MKNCDDMMRMFPNTKTLTDTHVLTLCKEVNRTQQVWQQRGKILWVKKYNNFKSNVRK
jgi:hypothetical protein